jgi:hypothetical protein
MIRGVVLTSMALLLAGCSVPTKRWPNETKDFVWTAMVAAANAPDYFSDDPRKRWIVIENDVDANPQFGRIVVRRKLSRSLKLPRQREQIDHREWLFVIRLKPQEVPTVTFDDPETQLVPARILDEATRYFSQVDSLLQKPIE